MAEFSGEDPRILRHRRLFGDLDTACARHAVSWISGPAPAGKTTLIASYIAARRHRCVWRTLDPADRDIGTFFHYLSGAASRLSPVSASSGDASSDGAEFMEHAPDSRDRASTFARCFFRRLGDKIGRPGLIVLDAAEHLSGEAMLEDAVRAAEASLTCGQNLIVVGRDPPPGTLQDLSLRGAIVHIRESALAFSLEELEEVARLRFGELPGISEAIVALHAETGGWAATVAARFEELEHGLRASRTAAGAQPRERPAREAERELLASLGQSLVGALTVQGEVEAAVEGLQKRSDVAGLAALLRERAPLLYAQRRCDPLRAWLRWVAERSHALDPWLSYWRSRVELATSPEEAAGFAERAYHVFSAAGDRRGAACAWAAAVEATLASPSLEALDRWLDWLDAAPTEEEAGDAMGHLTASALTAFILRRPEDARLGRWVERGWSVLRGALDAEPRASLAAALLRYHQWFGSPARLELLVEALCCPVFVSSSSPAFDIVLSHARAAAHQVTGAFDESLAAASEGLVLAAATGVCRYDAALHLDVAYALLRGAGDARQLPAALARARASLTSAEPVERDLYHYLASWDALARGELALARERALEGAVVARRVGSKLGERLATLALAAVSLESGTPDSESIARAVELAPERSAFGFAASLVVADPARDGAASVEAIGLALGRGRAGGFKTLPPLPLRSKTAARVLATALESDIDTEYARALLHEHGLIDQPPSLDLERWPWQVRVFAFGRFQLLVRGEPLRFVAKAQRRPLDLLKAMIALGGRDVSEEELADVLWPEAEADAAERTLAITLHRLRILLKDENAVERRARTLTLSERHVWVDANAFERRLADARAERGEARRLALERAVALYRAPFLTGESLACATVMRERLRSKFVQRVLELAELTEAHDGRAGAEQVYLRALEAEPLVERLYLELMKLQAVLGHTGDAEATYRRCREVLRNALGTTPSLELETARSELSHPSSRVSTSRRAMNGDLTAELVSRRR